MKIEYSIGWRTWKWARHKVSLLGKIVKTLFTYLNFKNNIMKITYIRSFSRYETCTHIPHDDVFSCCNCKYVRTSHFSQTEEDNAIFMAWGLPEFCELAHVYDLSPHPSCLCVWYVKNLERRLCQAIYHAYFTYTITAGAKH